MDKTTAFNSRLEGSANLWPLGKIVCVGRNYAEHAAELNNPVPEQPLLFIKPATSAADMQQPLQLPQGVGDVHYETEIALLIGKPLSKAQPQEALAAVAGVGLALDLTLRDLQTQLKNLGHPWERAKAWDGACPLSHFVAAEKVKDDIVITGTPAGVGKLASGDKLELVLTGLLAVNTSVA